MRNKSSNDEMLNGFSQRIRGGDSINTHELVIARFETTRFELTNILRWEDNGGQSILPPVVAGRIHN